MSKLTIEEMRDYPSEHFYCHSYEYRIKPFKIYGNLYFVGDKDVSSHLIDTGEGLILIDTGYPTSQGLLVQSIWELGFNPKDIKYIIHTHGHYDHFGATNLLKILSGAKTFLGERDARMFETNYDLTLNYVSFYCYAATFIADIEMKDDDTIKLGNTEIHIIATPGHSDGCMSVFFDVTENGLTYRAGMHGGLGLNTVNKNFIEQFGNTHSKKEFIDSIEKVYNEKVDICLGNHTIQNKTEDKINYLLQNPNEKNPFIDSNEFKRVLSEVREAYYEMIESEK